MSKRTGQVFDEYGTPVAGAEILVVRDGDGAVPALTTDLGQPLTQPLTTDTFGFYSYNAPDGLYREEIRWGGRTREKTLAAVGLGNALFAAGLPADPAQRQNRFLVFDAAGQSVSLASGTGADAGLRSDLGASSGGGLVNVTSGGTGAVTRSVSAKLADVLDVRDFGAALGGADDTAAVQAAINAAAAQRKVLRFPGAIRHGAVTVPSGVNIVGPSCHSTVTAVAGSYDLYTVTGSDVTIENLRVEAAAKTGGWEFAIATGTSATLERINFRNILILNSRGGFRDTGGGIHITTRLQSVQMRGHNGRGVNWTRGFAFLFLNEVTVDFVGVATSNYTGFLFDFGGITTPGAGGLFLRDCDVLGTAGTYNLANQRGFDIRNTAAVGIYHCRADTVGEKGFVFDTVNKLKLRGAEAGLCGGHSFEFKNVTNCSGFAEAYGRRGLAYAPADADGFHFISGCADVRLVAQARDHTRHGVNKAAVQAGAITLTGVDFSFNGGRGINSTGDSPLYSTGKLGGNDTGDFSLLGQFDYFTGMTNAGSVVFARRDAVVNMGSIGFPVPVPFAGTAYTLNSNDLGGFIRFTAGAPITVTIPPNSAQAFPLGAIVEIEKAGAGDITIAGGAGVTVASAVGLTITTQFTSRKLRKVGTDAWNVMV